ncbi:tyrosine-type recombinase/integrase [Streptomyces sp. CB02400]|uniref:tyrosine-type recombinase/integrase n=1 Tax=Streptomyces sp. CB02400 TaxID=1703944 RepID=UPI000A92A526
MRLLARQLARGTGSSFKDCGCSRPTRCPHSYTIRFRNGLGKQVEESGFDTQDDAIERLTQIYAEKKRTALAVAADDLALGIAMTAGCGLRNGEARAVNVNNVVADDVYRVHEQVHSNTHRPAKLEHRKVGKFREVPLPRSVREAIERHEAKHGATREGYLLRGPSGYYTEPMERRRVRALFEKLSVVDGMGMYGFRHYFASNVLGSGIPITDVAEWMGHKSIEETYRTYRHLMPGSITKAARVLDAGLWDAA